MRKQCEKQVRSFPLLLSLKNHITMSQFTFWRNENMTDHLKFLNGEQYNKSKTSQIWKIFWVSWKAPVRFKCWEYSIWSIWPSFFLAAYSVKNVTYRSAMWIVSTVLYPFLYGQKKKKHDSTMFGNSAVSRSHITTVFGNTGKCHMKCEITWTTEFLAFDLSNSFVRQTPGAGAACTTGLYWVGMEIIRQPLEMTVTNKGVLGQMPFRNTYRTLLYITCN